MKTAFLKGLLLAIVTSAACAQSAPDESPLWSALDGAIVSGSFKEITSVLVSTDGALIHEAYWGEFDSDSLHDTRSAMKSLTALATGAAIEDEFIASVDAKALVWFEAERPFRFSTELKEQITVRDLLTMSSAFDCDDNVWESPGNEEHMYPARRWLYFVLDLPTAKQYRRDTAGLGRFAYCTANSFLLGQIIQRATGERVDRYIARRLLLPLGIEYVAWDTSPSGEIMTGGGAEFSSRDLLKLGELILNDGEYRGRTVLSSSWVADMTTKHRAANERQGYGYQIWHEQFQCGNAHVSGWYMSGNGGNKVAIFDDLDTVVVVTATLYGTRGMHQQSADIIEQYILPSLPACQIA